MKPTKDFKLSKVTKTILGSILNPSLRSHWKNMMIQAQLSSEKFSKESAKKREKTSDAK